jgi:hypothetical protein
MYSRGILLITLCLRTPALLGVIAVFSRMIRCLRNTSLPETDNKPTVTSGSCTNQSITESMAASLHKQLKLSSITTPGMLIDPAARTTLVTFDKLTLHLWRHGMRVNMTANRCPNVSALASAVMLTAWSFTPWQTGLNTRAAKRHDAQPLALRNDPM